MTISKLIGGVAAFALAIGFVSFAPAQAATANWNVSGTCTVNFNYQGGTYPHTVTLNQDSSGNLTGSGTSGGGQFSYNITNGAVVGNTLYYYATYTADASAVGTTFQVNGSIASDGSVSGTWYDNYGGGSRTGTWTSTCPATSLVTTTTTNTFTGEGRIGTSKGKPQYTFEVNDDGSLTIVNHSTTPPCVYTVSNTQIGTYNNITGGTTVSFSNVTGKAGKNSCPALGSVMFTDNTTGGDSVKIGSTSYPVSGGMFTVTSTTSSNNYSEQTFSASNSTYYNGSTDAAPVYATGPISFTWDGDGNVTTGYYDEIIGGTTYFNMITGGTVSGSNVNLTFDRTNPNANHFTFTGSLTGDMLTGQLDGPYYFTASGSTM